MVRYALTLLAIGFAISAQVGAQDSKDDAVKKELAKLTGTWKVTLFEIDGKKPRTDDELEKFLVTFDADGKCTVQLNGKVIVESTNKIDPAKTPKTLDQTFTMGGGGAGNTSLAIYELKDDTLKACYADPGDPRPTKFKGNTLVVYKRQKGK